MGARLQVAAIKFHPRPPVLLRTKKTFGQSVHDVTWPKEIMDAWEQYAQP
jgi:hypothetical protein